MIVSALDDCLQTRINLLVKDISKLRLFSDSCFGQNKNIFMMAMLSVIRKITFPGISIEYTFPVRGHSFLPADRVFGRIQQSIKKKNTILLPEQYYSILREHGNLYVYGKDWNAFDYKSETSYFIK